MQYNFDFAVNRVRWSLRSLGLWPIDNDRFSELRFFLALTCMVLSLISTVAYCFVAKSILMELDAVILIISKISAIIKIMFIRTNKQNLKPILKKLSDDWNTISKLPIESQKIMISNAKRGRLLNLYLLIFLYSSTVVYLSTPIILLWKRSSVNETVQRLPFKSHYPFDFETSPTYEFIYISQCISGIVIATVIVSADCFLAVIISHLCGQLEILSRNIENINDKNIENRIHDTCCKCLKCIIQRHLQLIRNADVIQETYGIIILSQVTGNVFVLCIQGYTIIKVSSARNFFGILSYMMYVVFSSYTDFTYCYIGEYLIEKSTCVGHKAYELKWYNFKPQHVRSMILIIIRSQKQLELSARNFFSMSFSTFTNIITSALSYASFLLAINEKDL